MLWPVAAAFGCIICHHPTLTLPGASQSAYAALHACFGNKASAFCLVCQGACKFVSLLGDDQSLHGLQVWENLRELSAQFPVDGNKGGSYLTMLSKGGFVFGIINIVGNFGTVYNDQVGFSTGSASTAGIAALIWR